MIKNNSIIFEKDNINKDLYNNSSLIDKEHANKLMNKKKSFSLLNIEPITNDLNNNLILNNIKLNENNKISISMKIQPIKIINHMHSIKAKPPIYDCTSYK